MTFFAKKVVISVFPRVSAGRIGALRRQSAAIPGEGLHSNVRPSLAAHCGMYCKGECSDESRCFDFAPKGAPLNMTAKAVTPSEAQRNRGVSTVKWQEPLRIAAANVRRTRDLSTPLSLRSRRQIPVIPSVAAGAVEESRRLDEREPVRIAMVNVPHCRDVSTSGLRPSARHDREGNK